MAGIGTSMFPARRSSTDGVDLLANMGWQDFEHQLAEYYRGQGYRVEHHAPATSLKALGSSVDLRLRRGRETVILQCKHWDAVEVQLIEVNELLSIMINEAATAGILVTRGGYSREARAVLPRQPRLQLIDGDVLRVMLKIPDPESISLPDAEKTRRKTAGASRDRASASTSSRWLPILLVFGIALLLGLFIWKAMSPRREPAQVSANETTTPPPVAPIPVPESPPAPLPPPSRAADAVIPQARTEPSAAGRELAERERLREAAATSRASRQQDDEAMKVMERNTREVGKTQ